jgi:fructose-1,6-bisphosphatase I
MKAVFQSNVTEMDGIYSALFHASSKIYAELKKGAGLSFLDTKNESGDGQIGLDVIADEVFFEALSQDEHVKFVISEERPSLNRVSNGRYSVTLDPLDGSKSALVGIPSGAIFGIFDNVENEHDFNGLNIVAGGFCVFGINLEVYFADGKSAFKGIFDEKTGDWHISELPPKLPSSRFFAINASNLNFWHTWLQKHYCALIDPSVNGGKIHNLRWYASMVSEVKRLVLQGGVFAYPADVRDGYENGHLRLVYEAIPMAYLIEVLGGKSTDGNQSILDKKVEQLHQKTSVFLGESDKIILLEEASRCQ